MKVKNFMNFVTFLTYPDCPWATSVIKQHKTYIEVKFITSCVVRPSDLGWLNTHAIGGEWFVTTEDDEIHIVVRFHDEKE